MADDITRHLAGLSEELILENVISWEQVIMQVNKMLERHSSRYWTQAKLEFIQSFARSKEARLFRAGLSRVYLTISTAPKNGLERGDHFLRLIWNEKNVPVLEYCRFGKTSIQRYTLTTFDDPLFQLLPYLKRLWYEGKNKAEIEQEDSPV